MKDLYYRWLKRHGAYDFIKEIIQRGDDYGFKVGPKNANLVVDRIVAENLSVIVGRLSRFGRSGL